jgi:hypothetical protein
MTSTSRIARWLAAAAIAGVVFAAIPRTAAAQGYAIPWSNVDGGGAPPPRMSGGTLTLSGTAGQPDAGVLAGGGFDLQGGFWGVPIPRLLDAGTAPALAPGRLTPARPNPFSVSTEVAFALAHDSPVRLQVFDVAGHRVRTLANGANPAGSYRVHWDGAGDDGRQLPSGMYFIHLDTEAAHATQRVVLVH